jgi:uncharacterized membrane protein
MTDLLQASMQVVVIDIDLKSKQGNIRNLGNGLEKARQKTSERVEFWAMVGVTAFVACWS